MHPAAEVTNLTADQMVVNESDSIRISCEARGSPPLIITWRRAISPNQIIRLSENTNMYSSYRNKSSCNINFQLSVIEIHSAKAEDGVEYICQAQNDLPYARAYERLKINIQSGYYTIIHTEHYEIVSQFHAPNYVVVNECASAPCQNGGECVDEYLAFSCNCLGTNHTGDKCQEPIQTVGEL